MLTPLAENLWTYRIDRPFMGLRFGARMTVVRLPDGGLWVHSPVALDDALQAALAELGPTRHVIAPNRFHHMYVGDHLAAAPDAQLHAAPGLAKKRKDLVVTANLGDVAPADWGDQLDVHVLKGGDSLSEVVFLHRPSRTLIGTDLVLNLGAVDHWWTRTYLKMAAVGTGVGVSRVIRACFRDRSAARRSIDRVLDWDFDRLVMSHGSVVESDAAPQLKDAWQWL